MGAGEENWEGEKHAWMDATGERKFKGPLMAKCLRNFILGEE